MVRNITVVKQSRDDPIPDRPINFPPLENLHLELLENKKKLRPGAPLVPIVRRKPPKPKPLSPPPQSPPPQSPPSPPPQKSEPEKREGPSKEDPVDKKEDIVDDIVDEEDDKLVAELGEDDNSTAEIESPEDENVVSVEEDEDLEEDDPYAGLTPEEREAKEKEEYIWRFRLLKKQYKSSQNPIPDFNEHSDIKMMKLTYDRTIRELYLDDAVETYRTYLVGGFMLMEYACTQWAGIDLSGFTTQQTRMMYKYDRLLIELGEKSYNRWGMNLPVEVRLIGFILLQAGIFYLGKIISDKFGNNIADLFRGMTGHPPPSRTTPGHSEGEVSQKRRMRGPKIKPEDIRNMHAGKKDS